jgi:DnaJ-class molecular chaperone
VQFKDYYKALGVKKKATEDEIKRAYRKLARKHHPDLNPGDKAAEAKFKEINEANEVLGDPESRRKYDELGANWRDYESGGGPAADPSGWASHFSGGPRGRRSRTMTPEEMRAHFGGEDPFSDFFHAFFGGAGGGRPGAPPRPTRGRDLEQHVELTLEEAFAGTTRRVAISSNGQSRTVEVRIPAGVKNAARVRASGEGLPSSTGGGSGDLYLAVRVRPHAEFERRGHDLHTRVPVPLTTLVLGGEVSVPKLGGGTLRLKVPELTPAGRVFRLRGHGMPIIGKNKERGDMYASVEIQLPEKLSDDQRKHYEALKTLEEETT